MKNLHVMSSIHFWRRLNLAAVSALLICLPLAFGQEKKKEAASAKTTREVYSATAISVGGTAGGKSVGMTMYIDSYTPDDEVARLAEILKTKGEDGLTSALEKLKVGRIAPTGSTGNDVSVARSRPMEAKRRIILVSNRRMSFAELRNQPRSVDYPHSWIELHVDANGNGDGTMMTACKIKFNKKKGQYEVESYGNTPVRLLNVRREK